MSALRQPRDTFLHFLADNIDSSIPIHAIRYDPNDPAAGLLQTNAVNVSFLDADLNTVCEQIAIIDIVNDDENTAVDWVAAVFALLRAAYYTTLLDYTVPASPVNATPHTNLMWSRSKVRFKRVEKVDTYCHFSCSLPLSFYIA